MRRTIGLAIVLTAAAALAAPATGAQPGKPTLSVERIHATPALKGALEAAGKGPSLQRVVESFDSQLIDRLHATRKFEVVAVSDLAALIKSQDRSAEAPGNKPPRYGLVATLDDFEDSIERMTFNDSNSVGLKRKIRLSVIAKIYNVTSGAVYETANVRLLKSDSREDSAALHKDAELTDELLVLAVNEAAQKAAERVVEVAFPARVIDSEGKQITINRGDSTGVAVGQVWDVYRVSDQALVDPDTGEVLGRKKTLLGKARILSVEAKLSIAEMLDSKEAPLGSELRLGASALK